MKICNGIKDKNNGCKHEWIYVLDSNINEEYFYPLCVRCGLKCRIKIPSDCLIREKCKTAETENFENSRNKNCEECEI